VSGDQAYGLWPLVLLNSGLFIPAWTRYAVRSPGSCPGQATEHQAARQGPAAQPHRHAARAWVVRLPTSPPPWGTDRSNSYTTS
jgi:hypothetical protein